MSSTLKAFLHEEAELVGRRCLLQVIIFSILKIVKPRFHVCDQEGCTALWYCARLGHSALCRLLLRRGAGVDRGHRALGPPLVIAARRGRGEVCRLLLQHGAGVDMTGSDGFTSLMLAARAGNVELTELLLGHGADVDLGSPEWSPLMLAVHHNHKDVCRVLLSAGANVDFVDDTGRSCLLLAVEDGLYEISDMLLENGAGVDLRQPRDGATPLLRAAADGSPDLCSLLLRRGADVNDSWRHLRPSDGRPAGTRRGGQRSDVARGRCEPGRAVNTQCLS